MVENEEKIEDMYDDDADDDEDRKKQPSNSSFSFFYKTPTSANIQCTKRKRMKADELDRDYILL